jgi:hypothetical protein
VDKLEQVVSELPSNLSLKQLDCLRLMINE